jgi:uncharacterized protein (TIGR04255 family)
MTLSEICYKKNYVKEVIFRVDYSPILKIMETISPDFQESIRSDFPILEPVLLNKTTTLLGKGRTLEERVDYPEWNFYSNKERTLRLCASPEYLFVRCSKYDTFENLKQAIVKIYQPFLEAYRPLNLTRLGLRYINEINLPEGNPFDWRGLIAEPLLDVLDSFVKEKTEVARTMGQTILNKENYLLNFSYGLFNKSEFPGRISRREFILDYDCYTETVGELETIKYLELFHDDIQSMFEQSIGDDLRDIMESKKHEKAN